MDTSLMRMDSVRSVAQFVRLVRGGVHPDVPSVWMGCISTRLGSAQCVMESLGSFLYRR
jgi:hypothetical protein